MQKKQHKDADQHVHPRSLISASYMESDLNLLQV